MKQAISVKQEALVEKDDYNVKIGKAIARQRKKAGLTQDQVADFLKVKKGTVSRIENGAIAVGIDKIYDLHKLFNCHVSDFLWVHNDERGKLVADALDILRSLPEEKRPLVFAAFKQVMEDAGKALAGHGGKD